VSVPRAGVTDPHTRPLVERPGNPSCTCSRIDPVAWIDRFLANLDRKAALAGSLVARLPASGVPVPAAASELQHSWPKSTRSFNMEATRMAVSEPLTMEQPAQALPAPEAAPPATPAPARVEPEASVNDRWVLLGMLFAFGGILLAGLFNWLSR